MRVLNEDLTFATMTHGRETFFGVPAKTLLPGGTDLYRFLSPGLLPAGRAGDTRLVTDPFFPVIECSLISFLITRRS